MATVTQFPTPRKRATHTGHRQAFGPHRKRTADQKALHVAQSIALRHDAGAAWDWSTYGLEDQPAKQALVVAALLEMALEGR